MVLFGRELEYRVCFFSVGSGNVGPFERNCAGAGQVFATGGMCRRNREIEIGEKTLQISAEGQGQGQRWGHGGLFAHFWPHLIGFFMKRAEKKIRYSQDLPLLGVGRSSLFSWFVF